METTIKVKDWKIENKEGKEVITGLYSVMLGDKVIATQAFNTGYGGVEIKFDRAVDEAVKAATKSICESITSSFTN